MRSTITLNYNILLKLWINPWNMHYYPNFKGFISKFPLHIFFFRKIFIHCNNHKGNMNRLNHTIYTYKWGINIFYIYISSLIPRNILFQSYPQGSLKQGSHYYDLSHGNLVPGLRSTLRANILLSCGCNH